MSTAELPAEPLQHPSQRVPVKVDGRNLRRDRNKIAVIDAFLDLIAEGNLRPSVAEVAERSGVSHRSVFRYFADTDELARSSVARQVTRIESLLESTVDLTMPLAARIDLVIDRRLRLFAAIGPVARLVRLLAPEQTQVKAELRLNRSLYRLQLSRMFTPELEAMDAERSATALAILDVVCSFDAFDLLTDDQELSPEQTAAALRLVLTALLS